jgi:hypothetical protein
MARRLAMFMRQARNADSAAASDQEGVDIARLSEATRLVDGGAECQRGQRADTGHVRRPLLSRRKFSRCRLGR